MDIGDCKKRVVDRRSPENRRASAPDTVVSPSPNRRVKGRRDSGSWAESGGLDDVTAALPETLDLSGHADLSTEALRVLLFEHPRTCILKLDGCVGLGDDAIACICSIIGEHITELSLAGCTQFTSETLMLQFHENYPSLHTLNILGCSQVQSKDMALMVVSRVYKSLPRIEIRS